MISQTCTINNGVKEEACMSSTLFSIYLDKLLGILQTSFILQLYKILILTFKAYHKTAPHQIM